MRELPEARAHFGAIASAGFTQSAANLTPGQRPKTTASTFFLYGYLVGKDADKLLCGHPDLVY